MIGYSLCVNGENQTKLKEKSRVRHGEDVVLRGKDVCHNEAVVRQGEEKAD